MTPLCKIILTGIVFLFAITSCEKTGPEVDIPDCIEKEISKIKKEKVRNPPAKVWEWKADGKTYYYITSDCCDQFNYLYDKNCNVVCAPDGGINGNGDGKCPDITGPVEKTLIWEDDRQTK